LEPRLDNYNNTMNENRESVINMSAECVQWLILRSFKRNVNFEENLKLEENLKSRKYQFT